MRGISTLDCHSHRAADLGVMKRVHPVQRVANASAVNKDEVIAFPDPGDCSRRVGCDTDRDCGTGTDQRSEANSRVLRTAKLYVCHQAGISQVGSGQQVHPPWRPLSIHTAGL